MATKRPAEAAAPSAKELKTLERCGNGPARLGTLPPPSFFLPSFPSHATRLGGLRASAPVNRTAATVASLRPHRQVRPRAPLPPPVLPGQRRRHRGRPNTHPGKHSLGSALRHPCLRKWRTRTVGVTSGMDRMGRGRGKRGGVRGVLWGAAGEPALFIPQRRRLGGTSSFSTAAWKKVVVSWERCLPRVCTEWTGESGDSD